MTLVSIDVPACRDAAGKMTALSGRATGQSSLVQSAASSAGESAPSLAAVAGLTAKLDAAADGLNARVDLAVIVNGGDEGALNNGAVTYDVPSDDSGTVKYQLGQELGQQGSTILGDDDGDQKRLERWKTLMSHWVKDPDVMTSMYMKLGPDKTLDLTAVVGRLGFQRDDGNLPIAQLIKDGLTTASLAWTPSNAHEFGVRMADHAGHLDEDLPGKGDYTGGGQSIALSYLMYKSSMGPDLLTGVADGIDDIERNHDVPRGFWQMKSSSAFSGLVRGFDKQDLGSYWDPMTSTFGALAGQPKAALDWFTSGGDDREKYWIKDRVWGHDDFRNIAKVLNAASTDSSLIDPPLDAQGNPRPDALNASRLASAAVTYLAANKGFGWQQTESGILGVGDKHEYVGTSAGASLAHIVSTYLPAVDSALSSDWHDTPSNASGALDSNGRPIKVMPAFTRADLSAIITVASQNVDGFRILREGVSSYNDRTITTALRDTTSADNPRTSPVTDAITHGARLEGYFAYNVGGGSIHKADDTDARQKAWVDLGSEVVGAIPVPGGDAVGFLVNKGLSLTTDQVNDAVTGHGAQARDAANTMADRSRDAFFVETTQTLSERNALPSQTHDGPALSDSAGIRNGVVLTPDQLAALSPDERADAFEDIKRLAFTRAGVGYYAPETDLQNTYDTSFHEFFPAK